MCRRSRRSSRAGSEAIRGRGALREAAGSKQPEPTLYESRTW